MDTKMLLIHRHALVGNLNSFPAGYVQKSWIGSDGKAYIDTKIYPVPSKTRLWIRLSMEEGYVIKAVLGSRKNTGFDQYACSIFNYTTGLRLDWTGASNYFEFVQGEQHEIDCLNNTVTIDGNEFKSTVKKSDSQLSGSILLFNINTGTTPDSRIANARIYACRIWDENGGLARDFAPCMRESDGAYGLYDFVSKTFFGSNNTQKLIGG